MTVPVRQQALFWGATAAIFFLLLWGLGNVILPFIVGSAIAYFLDPVADRIERWGLSRTAATVIISVVALLGFILLAMVVIPLLARQLAQLINDAPTILNQLQTYIVGFFPDTLEADSVFRDTMTALGRAIQARGGELASSLLSSAISVINWIVFLVVVPVVAFYMLLDWDHMVARIDEALPLEHRETVREIARDIDKVLAGFVRGQVLVCAIMGVYYSTGLILAGLQFGLIVGAIAGFVTFIPYVGALIGGALALGLALYQFWGDWLHVGAVAIIFAIGQFTEGNIITPRLVGKSVGLHPVWLLFALSAMGTLFGFVGMLVAVPVAASIGVLMRFMMGRYRASVYYRGNPADLARASGGRDEG